LIAPLQVSWPMLAAYADGIKMVDEGTHSNFCRIWDEATQISFQILLHQTMMVQLSSRRVSFQSKERWRPLEKLTK
jgi:hypothetical protein